jgi:hypothetical protein
MLPMISPKSHPSTNYPLLPPKPFLQPLLLSFPLHQQTNTLDSPPYPFLIILAASVPTKITLEASPPLFNTNKDLLPLPQRARSTVSTLEVSQLDRKMERPRGGCRSIRTYVTGRIRSRCGRWTRRRCSRKRSREGTRGRQKRSYEKYVPSVLVNYPACILLHHDNELLVLIPPFLSRLDPQARKREQHETRLRLAKERTFQLAAKEQEQLFRHKQRQEEDERKRHSEEETMQQIREDLRAAVEEGGEIASGWLSVQAPGTMVRLFFWRRIASLELSKGRLIMIAVASRRVEKESMLISLETLICGCSSSSVGTSA